jgi:hypothetical protein
LTRAFATASVAAPMPRAYTGARAGPVRAAAAGPP